MTERGLGQHTCLEPPLPPTHLDEEDLLIAQPADELVAVVEDGKAGGPALCVSLQASTVRVSTRQLQVTDQSTSHVPVRES